jgi:NADH-quinone oxidoreductase subunit E
MNAESKENSVVATILESHRPLPSEIIPILQEIQAELGYLPSDAMRAVARFVRAPESAIFGVATFYSQFYLTPQGRHKVRVCQGTACHVRGGTRIMQEVRKLLGINPGETTPDYEFSLERVACLGSCALAPVMVVDRKVHGSLTAAKAKQELERLGRGRAPSPERPR